MPGARPLASDADRERLVALLREHYAAGLFGLDELTLMISPVVAGGGRRRLFPGDAAPATFELAEATPTSTGTLIATYRPA